MVMTEKERALFEALGEGRLVELVERGAIVAPKAYEMAASNAFVEDKRGPAVEALRRALKAFVRGEAHRRTEKFEELITF